MQKPHKAFDRKFNVHWIQKHVFIL